MEKKLKVLILEDLPSDAELAKREVRKVLHNPVIKVVDTEKDYIQVLGKFSPDIIISDYRMPTFTGMEALNIRMEKSPNIPFIMLTGSMNEVMAVECIKAGADDYVIKEHIKRLGQAVLGALEKKRIERRRIENEKALKISEDKYRNIFENAPDGIIQLDLNLNIIDCNRSECQLLGYKRNEIIGKHITEILTKDSIEISKKAFLALQKEGHFDTELSIVRKDGSVIPIWRTANSVYNEEGKFIGAIVHSHNITNRKKADKLQSVVYSISRATHSTKNLEELYKLIHNILKDVLDVTNFYIAHYNEKEQTLSFPFYKDEADDFPEAAEPFGNGITEYVIKTGKPLLLNKKDILNYNRKGKFEAAGAMSEQWLGAPLKIENRVNGVIAVNSYHDPNLYNHDDLNILTFVSEQIAKAVEQKQAITDLQVEKTYLNELFTSSPEALALVTTDNTILHINKHFTLIFGYEEEEIVGRNIDELLIPPEQWKEAQKHTDKVASGKHVRFDVLRQRKDGSMVDVSVLGSPINYKGDVLAVYVIYRDITDRITALKKLKKSEERFRKQSVELSESNSMKEMLLDVIAHDLRNPAGVIKGFADFGLEMDPNNEILKEINGGVDNLLNVIRDATILSKVALGDTIKKEELDLISIINNIIKDNSSALQFAEMTLDLNAEDKILVNANPIIGEVFRNYISNAIKYAPDGKKIMIDTDMADKYIAINVKDFGTTIDEKDRENVFTRNIQLGKTKGRGLGLAIVKRIAEAHDAEVGVMPNIPKGNNFYIKIPMI